MEIAIEQYVTTYLIVSRVADLDAHTEREIMRHFAVTVEKAGHPEDSFAVRRYGECLSRSGVWHYEPSPSNRSDYWLSKNRFPLEEALERARKAVPKLTMNGRTLAQVVEDMAVATVGA